MNVSATTPDPPSAAVTFEASFTARVVAAVGAVEVLLFGGLTWACLWAGGRGVGDLYDRVGGERISFEQVAAVHGSLSAAAVMLLALGVAPGVAYLVASLGIHRGRPAGRFVAMMLLATQVLVLSGLLLFQAVGSIAAGSPPALTLNVLALGTPIAALLFTLRCLWRMRA